MEPYHQTIINKEHTISCFIPWQAGFSATPGLMLCSIICMRSALAFEGGHQISVNLFLKAGDSCKKTVKFNIISILEKATYVQPKAQFRHQSFHELNLKP